MAEKRFPCLEQPLKCRLLATRGAGGTEAAAGGTFGEEQQRRVALRKNGTAFATAKRALDLSEFWLLPCAAPPAGAAENGGDGDNSSDSDASSGSTNLFMLKSSQHEKNAYLTVQQAIVSSNDSEGATTTTTTTTTATTATQIAGAPLEEGADLQTYQWRLAPRDDEFSFAITSAATGGALSIDADDAGALCLVEPRLSPPPPQNDDSKEPAADSDDGAANAAAATTTTSWKLEFLSGELLFVSALCSTSGLSDGIPSTTPLQIRCDVFGRLALTPECRGWEVWRFIEAGENRVRIQSWMHNRYLCVQADAARNKHHQDHDGRSFDITTSSEPGTLWEVEKVNNNNTGVGEGVLLRDSETGRLLCWKEAPTAGSSSTTTPRMELGTTVQFDRGATTVSENAIWQLESAHQQQYTLHCADDNRSLGPFPWVSDNHKQVDAFQINVVTSNNSNGTSDDDWINNNGTDNTNSDDSDNNKNKASLLALRTNQYVGVDTATGKVVLQETPCFWSLNVQLDGTYQFYTAVNSRDEPFFLAAVQHETTDAKKVPGELQLTASTPFAWRLDPVMPRAVSSQKIRTFAAGTTLAVATTVAMPFAVAGVVGLIGTEMGILANAVAVTLTGAEAIASVGVVGATAAICFRQSADTLSASLRDPNNNGSDGEEETTTCPYSKRPFCDWRSW